MRITLLHLHHIYDSQDHRFHAARGSSGHGVIVERVIEKSVMGITYPVLTRTNYSEWSLVMRVNLQAAGLASRMAPLIIMKIGMR
jgi:hypothetical protein